MIGILENMPKTEGFSMILHFFQVTNDFYVTQYVEANKHHHL